MALDVRRVFRHTTVWQGLGCAGSDSSQNNKKSPISLFFFFLCDAAEVSAPGHTLVIKKNLLLILLSRLPLGDRWAIVAARSCAQTRQVNERCEKPDCKSVQKAAEGYLNIYAVLFGPFISLLLCWFFFLTSWTMPAKNAPGFVQPTPEIWKSTTTCHPWRCHAVKGKILSVEKKGED